MVGEKNERPRIKTTGRIFEIVELLMAREGLRLTDVAQELGMSKSNAYRHLTTLKEVGYLVQEEGTYHPSMNFLDIGEYVRNRKKIYQLAHPKVEQLAEKTDERSEFVIEEHGRGVFVHMETGPDAVRTNTRVGKALPLHASAAGKAILAYLPDPEVQEIVETSGLERKTENTITNFEKLQEELKSIRQTSIAYNDEELISGLRAVGTPVISPNDEVLGAISITGPTNRLQGETLNNTIPNMLRGVANELELKIAYD